MNPTRVSLQFDTHSGPYWPGESIAGQWCVEAATPADVRAVELSVLWSTSGQGDEDLAVHSFERQGIQDDLQRGEPFGMWSCAQRFNSRLPSSPLTYDGILVKIHWCVRVRAFLASGKELVTERGFQLGSIRPAEMDEGE